MEITIREKMCLECVAKDLNELHLLPEPQELKQRFS